MRTRHQRTLIQSLCNHRALLFRESKSAHMLEMFRRLQSGRESSSSSSSSSSRTNDAPSSVRGMHATRTVQLIEDRDGRGLTEEIIEENLDRKRGEAMKQNDAYVESALLTTRKEALSLYRAVIRASVLFVWKDSKGHVWKDVIRESARKEFEQGKHERDPEMVNRLILSGREAVDVALDKFMEQRQKIMDEESKGKMK
ncbi:unnamed protein product [Bathycoccus prasinos]|mmetsp:Transcript_2541/g.8139  ORF Transcript_2541/g.8139 Transcript_2541/m.8139 type:complete len:199 (+) Transcript_2541:50-646(+)